MRKLTLICLCCLLSVYALYGQQTIIGPTERVASSFAIFIDKQSYSACKENVDKYKEILQQEGLATYLLVADWESPEHVKYFIKKYYNEQALEGAVFIGDIPVALVSGAQYLTSAFKMDEEKFPLRDSSVPSDRFYDDLNLKFDFIGKDSVETNFYYYRLSADSPQKISCTIYSGRIKPTQKGSKGHKQINDYLSKVIRERKEKNILVNVCSYTGSGSYSNSLNAWSSEGITLREQMPSCFKNADGAKFYMFYMQPYMKETVISELKRDELDLMLFHQHGLYNRMYLTSSPDFSDEADLLEAGKRSARRRLRRAVRNSEDTTKVIASILRNGVDRSWIANAFDKDVISKDSLEDVNQGIVLEDVPSVKPNPRVVIFDACYNGDFREQSCIASEFIFAEGKTIASCANSVNVLQDKSASDLLGLLACGQRIGVWAQYTNILESHILGDPTFRFDSYRKLPQIKFNTKDTTYWLAVLDHNLPCDIKGLALYKLFNFNYPQLPQLLLDVYRSSNEWNLRLQCLHLMAYYNNEGYYSQLLKLAVKDPYEFIRRKAAYYMGNVGSNEFVPYLVDLYMDDYLSERIAFNVIRSAAMLNSDYFIDVFSKKVENGGYVFNESSFKEKFIKQVQQNKKLQTMVLSMILDNGLSEKKKCSYLTFIKNNPSVTILSDLLGVLKDNSQSESFRTKIAEVLGWYTNCSRKQEIIDVCNTVLLNGNCGKPLSDELTKSINRLKTYMR